jgi:serine/threonine protein kinase
MTEEPDSLEVASLERVGRTLCGKWTLEKLLGVGGVAAVYAARHRNGRRVAIKVLHRELSVDSRKAPGSSPRPADWCRGRVGVARRRLGQPQRDLDRRERSRLHGFGRQFARFRALGALSDSWHQRITETML